MNVVTTLGGVATIIATLVGAYALIQARRTDKRTGNREEIELILGAQSGLLNRYEGRIKFLEDHYEDCEDRVTEMQGKLVVSLEHTADCENRLHILEARVAELGG